MTESQIITSIRQTLQTLTKMTKTLAHVQNLDFETNQIDSYQLHPFSNEVWATFSMKISMLQPGGRDPVVPPPAQYYIIVVPLASVGDQEVPPRCSRPCILKTGPLT